MNNIKMDLVEALRLVIFSLERGQSDNAKAILTSIVEQLDEQAAQEAEDV